MQTTLTLSAQGLDAQAVQELTRDAVDLLRPHVDAETVEGAAAAGEKGGPLAIGAVLLELVTRKAIEALVNTIRAIGERAPTLEAAVTRPDGATFKISGGQLSGKQFERTVKLLEQFLEPPA
jgi:hypothetical protein